MTLRIAVLNRVSTPGQDKDDKKALDEYHDQLAAACKRLKAELVTPDKYRGVESGTKGKAGGDKPRVILNRLLADCKVKPSLFDAVMVADHSRWSREPPEALSTRDAVLASGKDFYVLDKRYNPDSAEDEMMFLIHCGFAKFYHRYVAKNTQRTMLHMAREGIWPLGKKTIRYGLQFDRVAKKFVEHKENAAKLRQVVRDVIRGASLVQIVQKYGNTMPAWTSRVRAANAGPVKLTLAGEHFEWPAPDLIPEAQRLRCIELWKGNNSRGSGRIYQYALSGKIKCGHCGSVMHGALGRVYVHKNEGFVKGKWTSLFTIGKCLRSVNAKEIEDQVFLLLRVTLRDRKRRKEIIAANVDNSGQLLADVQANRVALHTAMTAASKARQRDIDLGEHMVKAGGTVLRDWQKRLANHNAMAAQQEAEDATLRAQEESIAVSEDRATRAAIVLHSMLVQRGLSRKALLDILMGDGSLSRRQSERMTVGIFVRHGNKRGEWLLDLRTLVPVFDDAQIAQVARATDENVALIHAPSS